MFDICAPAKPLNKDTFIGVTPKHTFIGVTGAYRTGKTVLARALSFHLSLKFFEFQSQIRDTPQYNLSLYDIPFAENLVIQENILNEMVYHIQKIELLSDKGSTVVVDFSPFEILGYLFTSIDHTCNPLMIRRVNMIVNAVTAFAKIFSEIIIVQPGVPFNDTDIDKYGKKYANEIYQKAVTNSIFGSFPGIPDLPYDPIVIPDIRRSTGDRVDYVVRCLQMRDFK